MAFLSSGSTAGYVFLYSVYYFLCKTKMSGLLQTCFYFGYTCVYINLYILYLYNIYTCIYKYTPRTSVRPSVRSTDTLQPPHLHHTPTHTKSKKSHRALFCFALFLLCGAIGVAGATLFVRRIYTNLKVD